MTMTYSEVVRITDEATEALRRANAIARRVVPMGPTPHGFYEPEAFFDPARRALRTKRLRVFNDALPRVRAKLEQRKWWERTPAAARAREIDRGLA